MKFLIQIELTQNNLSCALLPQEREGEQQGGKGGNSQLSIKFQKTSHFSVLSLQICLEKRKNYTYSNLYRCSPNTVSVLEMALGRWLICL